MSAFLDETGTLITVSEVNPLPVTIVTTDYTEAELPDAARYRVALRFLTQHIK